MRLRRVAKTLTCTLQSRSTCSRARVLLRQARSVSVIPPVPGMAPPSAAVDALVNGSDGAADMVHVDHGVDLTLDR